LIAANTLAGGNTATHGPDVLNFGKIAAANHNVIQDGSDSGIADGVDGNQVGVAVLLDPAGLQDHGGPTPAIALLPGSPALNAGNSELAVDATGAPLEFDQRGFGFPRFVGASVDRRCVGGAESPTRCHDDAATTAEDTAIGIAVLDNDSDPDGDALIVVLPGGESGRGTGPLLPAKMARLRIRQSLIISPRHVHLSNVRPWRTLRHGDRGESRAACQRSAPLSIRQRPSRGRGRGAADRNQLGHQYQSGTAQ